MRFFTYPSEPIGTGRIFAVSDDECAVESSFANPRWKPLTPSRRLAHQVLSDQNIVELIGEDRDRALQYRDYPRNFNAGWRAEERWGGWVVACLLIVPCIPLWVLWDLVVSKSFAAAESALAVTALAQIACVLMLRDRIVQRVVRLAESMDQRRIEREQGGKAHNRPVTPPMTTTTSPSASRNPSPSPAPKIRSRDQVSINLEIDQQKAFDPEGNPVRRAVVARVARKHQGPAETPERKRKHFSAIHAEFVDRARTAGLDPGRIRRAIETMTPAQLRDAERQGVAVARQGRGYDLAAMLDASEIFETVQGFYVRYENRTFLFDPVAQEWCQAVPDCLPVGVPPTSTERLRAAVFKNPDLDGYALAAQFHNLAVNAVEPRQQVFLQSHLPDGRESVVCLHAEKWAAICLGWPIIQRDERAEQSYEWHFNDIPPQVTIYAVTMDAADPLYMLAEVNWRQLPRTIADSPEVKGKQ